MSVETGKKLNGGIQLFSYHQLEKEQTHLRRFKTLRTLILSPTGICSLLRALWVQKDQTSPRLHGAHVLWGGDGQGYI